MEELELIETFQEEEDKDEPKEGTEDKPEEVDKETEENSINEYIEELKKSESLKAAISEAKKIRNDGESLRDAIKRAAKLNKKTLSAEDYLEFETKDILGTLNHAVEELKKRAKLPKVPKDDGKDKEEMSLNSDMIEMLSAFLSKLSKGKETETGAAKDVVQGLMREIEKKELKNDKLNEKIEILSKKMETFENRGIKRAKEELSTKTKGRDYIMDKDGSITAWD